MTTHIEPRGESAPAWEPSLEGTQVAQAAEQVIHTEPQEEQ